MAEKEKKGQRSRVGYGSSYRKGTGDGPETEQGIRTVLGGQVWTVKPDKRPEAANPCIWMQAGAVAFKECKNFGDCTTCKYDLGMRRKTAQGKQAGWREIMRKREGLERTCRHTLANRIPGRACAYNYECAKCDFDQFFEDVWTTKTKTVPYDVQEVKGFMIPMGYYFHDGHSWARIESGGYIRVGMDDFSMKLLGRADALDLPLMGKELDGGHVGWGLKRQKNAAEFLSPVDGVIMEVNSDLFEKPVLASERPYEDGWLFVVRTPDVKGTVKQLMSDTEGLDWIHGETGKLEQMIEETAGPLALDGGYLGDDIFGKLPDLGWRNLTQTFLKT
jgi:glycine cleavage system H lipoate-binding protein